MKLILSLISIFSFSMANAQYETGQSFGGESSFSSSSESFLMNLSFFYITDSVDMSSSRVRNDLLLQVVLGYIYEGWIFGAAYDSDVETNKFNDTSGTTTYKWNRQGYGPLVGYTFMDYFIHFTYFISPSLTTSISSGSDTKYKGTYGFQIAAGYNYKFNRNFALGAQLVYRAFEYSESETGGTTSTLNPKYDRAALDPMIGMYIYF